MGKWCSLSRHTTFMLDGIADSKCKMVKNASQHLDLLFTGVEKILKFPCSSCQIRWAKPPRAFVKLVEGSVVSKFGIQTFVQFSYEFWRKFDSRLVTWNGCEPERVHPRDVAPRRTTSARRRTRARARRWLPATAGLRLGAVGTVHLRPMTHGNGLGRCHAASSHSPTRAPPLSIGRRPPHVANHLCAHADAPVATKPGWTASTRCWTYNPPFFPSCAHAAAPVRRRPPLALPVSFLLRVCLWPTSNSRTFPSPH
jgi:hypothetical protein